MVFPEVTHAATNPSSKRFPFPEESIRLISATLFFAGLDLSTPAYDLSFFYSPSKNSPKLPKQAKNGKRNKNGPKQNGPFNRHGNSTSTKKPKGKD